MGNISRRNFFRQSAAVAAGCAVSKKSGFSKNQEKPNIKRLKPFGKTGFKVSDISVGTGQRDPSLLKEIFDRGVNLIDTAYEYPGHEQLIGRILPEIRDKIFVVSKWNPPLVTPTVSKKELMDALDITLERLKTDYVDCMMVHAIGAPDLGSIDRIQNPAIYEAWDEAKKLGKVRFTGVSSHGPKLVEEVGWGIDNDRFDVILVGANFMTHGLEPLLKKARSKGVATMAMKTMSLFKSDMNKKIEGLVNQDTNIRQAVLKYVLAEDLFDTVCITMRNLNNLNEYVAVSGTTKMTGRDMGILKKLEENYSKDYCRPGCDTCLGSCPNNVPIADILRYKMYFEHYGDEKKAMAYYSRISENRNAAACENCTAPCERFCKFRIPIKDRLLDAHHKLTFA